MKTALLALALVALDARAEVVECPARQEGARLVGAGIHEVNEKVELMGAPRKVRGGVDADFGFYRGDVKWLACVYETGPVRWFRLSPEATKCELKQRDVAPKKVTATVRCK